MKYSEQRGKDMHELWALHSKQEIILGKKLTGYLPALVEPYREKKGK